MTDAAQLSTLALDVWRFGLVAPASQSGAVRASDRLCPSVVSGVCPWCVREDCECEALP